MLKSSLLYLLAIMLSLNLANAQKSEFGVHLGLNTFNIKNYTGYKHIYGFSGGAFFNQPINTNWSIQPEINFQMQGAKSNYVAMLGDISNTNFADKYRFGYLNLPVLLKYQLPHSKLIFFLGPQANYLLSAKYKLTPENYETATTNIRNDMNTFLLSGTYGIETYFLTQNNHKFIINVRFSNDYTHLNKEDLGKYIFNNSNSGKHGFNYGFALLLGYSL